MVQFTEEVPQQHEHSDQDEDVEDDTDELEGFNFSNIKPALLGGRTVSTQARLKRQGLRKSKKGNGGTNFVVQSIRRGSDDWRNLSKFSSGS
jgi:hypothetical protein